MTPRSRGRDRERGALAIVLHTHMPYVEGFGTWPFGEEWLWEAIAGCYLPLLDLLDELAPAITLSLTPVLADQLGAPGVADRFERFVEETRRYTHFEDARGLRAGGHRGLADELERAWREDYEHALQRFAARDRDLLAGFAPHARWTSSATHAVLPLLATDACVRLQVESGIASHLERFGGVSHVAAGRADGQEASVGASWARGGCAGASGEPGNGWRGGFWLPECAYAPHLEPLLARRGVRDICVELTGPLGLGAPVHLRPFVSESGLVLHPIDRATISLVWSEAGYPADGLYRDYHRHTVHHHNPWRNDGNAYDRKAALARARAHAADFVARVRERLDRDGAGLPGGGLVVCALDTELLGHWWYEGLAWLAAVIEESARQELELVRLDDARERFEPAPLAERPALGVSSWGDGHDLSTWSGPKVADLAFATRSAELQTIRAAATGTAGPAAVRELLALQASDWAFMISRDLAVPYARLRFDEHRAAHARALADGPAASVSGLRELARHADPRTLVSD